MSDGQRTRERPQEPAAAEQQVFRYESHPIRDGPVTYVFRSDTVDFASMNNQQLVEELRRPGNDIHMFQTGATGKTIDITNDFIKARVADRLEPARVVSAGQPTEAVPAERENARWVTIESQHEADGTYFRMQVNMNASAQDFTPQQRDWLNNHPYASPDELQAFYNHLSSRVKINGELFVGRG